VIDPPGTVADARPGRERPAAIDSRRLPHQARLQMETTGDHRETESSTAPARAPVGAALAVSVLLTPVGGYLALGSWRRALTFAGIECGLLALALVAILRSWPWAAWVCGILALASFVAAVVDLGRRARRTPPGRRRWALALAGIPALAAFFGGLQPVQAHLVDSFSTIGTMLPTLASGDRVLMDKRKHAVRRGDVVVFRFPPAPAPAYVQRAKRVVGLPGDTVELRDGTLLVNGTAVPARPLGVVTMPAANLHVRRPDDRYEEWQETLDARTYHVLRVPGAERSSFGPVTVPPGHFFMLGDNRDNNNDSRLYGPISLDAIIGRALWIWWSSGPNGGLQWDRLGRRL
jgi:signal peptidase I